MSKIFFYTSKVAENKIIIDVIVLSYAKNKDLEQVTVDCITSLMRTKKDNFAYNVIVVETQRKLSPFQYPNTTTIYPDLSFNFNKFINIGLQHCEGEFVCIANNDLLFEKDWALKILEAFEADATLESASPICPVFHPTVNIHPNTGNIYGYGVRNEIAGWCIVVRRSLLEKIGKFDEKFKFWFADADYAMTLKSKNIKHALVTSSIVEHLDGTSTKELEVKNKNAMTTGQFWYYQYKWEHKNFLLYLYRSFKSKFL